MYHPFWSARQLGDEVHHSLVAALANRPAGSMVRVRDTHILLFDGYRIADSAEANNEVGSENPET